MASVEQAEDCYLGNYMKTDDLRSPKVFTVDDWDVEEVGQEKKKKVVLTFSGGKRMVLNKTNYETIKNLFGTADHWPGKQILVYPENVSFGGKQVKGLRIKAPPRKTASPPAPSPQDYASSLEDYGLPSDPVDPA